MTVDASGKRNSLLQWFSIKYDNLTLSYGTKLLAGFSLFIGFVAVVLGIILKAHLFQLLPDPAIGLLLVGGSLFIGVTFLVLLMRLVIQNTNFEYAWEDSNKVSLLEKGAVAFCITLSALVILAAFYLPQFGVLTAFLASTPFHLGLLLGSPSVALLFQIGAGLFAAIIGVVHFVRIRQKIEGVLSFQKKWKLVLWPYRILAVISAFLGVTAVLFVIIGSMLPNFHFIQLAPTLGPTGSLLLVVGVLLAGITLFGHLLHISIQGTTFGTEWGRLHWAERLLAASLITLSVLLFIAAVYLPRFGLLTDFLASTSFNLGFLGTPSVFQLGAVLLAIGTIVWHLYRINQPKPLIEIAVDSDWDEEEEAKKRELREKKVQAQVVDEPEIIKCLVRRLHIDYQKGGEFKKSALNLATESKNFASLLMIEDLKGVFKKNPDLQDFLIDIIRTGEQKFFEEIKNEICQIERINQGEFDFQSLNEPASSECLVKKTGTFKKIKIALEVVWEIGGDAESDKYFKDWIDFYTFNTEHIDWVHMYQRYEKSKLPSRSEEKKQVLEEACGCFDDLLKIEVKNILEKNPSWRDFLSAVIEKGSADFLTSFKDEWEKIKKSQSGTNNDASSVIPAKEDLQSIDDKEKDGSTEVADSFLRRDEFLFLQRGFHKFAKVKKALTAVGKLQENDLAERLKGWDDFFSALNVGPKTVRLTSPSARNSLTPRSLPKLTTSRPVSHDDNPLVSPNSGKSTGSVPSDASFASSYSGVLNAGTGSVTTGDRPPPPPRQLPLQAGNHFSFTNAIGNNGQQMGRRPPPPARGGAGRLGQGSNNSENSAASGGSAFRPLS